MGWGGEGDGEASARRTSWTTAHGTFADMAGQGKNTQTGRTVGLPWCCVSVTAGAVRDGDGVSFDLPG